MTLVGKPERRAHVEDADVHKRIILKCNKVMSLFLIKYDAMIMGRDRANAITTGYGLDDRGVGVRVPVG
jgi:hypothetical protein